MGPRFFKRGDLSASWRHTHIREASMGPRFFKRGDSSAGSKLNSSAVASMGPRFFKRGDKDEKEKEAVAEELQWGHASLSVETSSP